MLKEMVRSLAHLSGYEIMSLSRAQGDRRCVAALLQEQQVNTVLDVGANTGQFAKWIRETGYNGKIVSFEPLDDAHQKLRQAAERDLRWVVAPRMALGSVPGKIDIHIAGNGVSSSILPMLAAHREAAPDSIYVEKQSVALERLDDVCPVTQEDRLLLKVDVQGYEKAVLDGAVQVLKNCRAIIIEMSLVPLYEGQYMALELWEHLTNLGFQACYFHPGFRDTKSCRMLQMDGVFVRHDGQSGGVRASL
jgi:FkbM family methyltransferase